MFATNYRRTQLSVQALLTGIQVKHRTIVEVRLQTTCSMSCYEAHSDVLIPTMKRVQSIADFKHATEGLRDVQEAMGKAFPALTAHGFEWIHALDYFVCRRSHSLDILPSLQVRGKLSGFLLIGDHKILLCISFAPKPDL